MNLEVEERRLYVHMLSQRIVAENEAYEALVKRSEGR